MEKANKVRMIREATGSERIATGLEKIEKALAQRGFRTE